MTSKSAAAYWKEYEEYLGLGSELPEPKRFPSGLVAIHYALSAGGGIPGGSIIQLLGEPGHGKSTLSMDLLAQAQKSGLREVNIDGRIVNAAILDFERSFDPDYAELFGVDVSKVLHIETKFAEDSFNIAEAALLEGLQFFIVDSIGVLVSKDEMDKDHNDAEKLGVEAKALGRFMKHVNAFMDRNTLVVVINQYRSNISKMGNAPDKKAYGARIMQYVTKLTLELRRIKQDGDRDHIEVFVQKNKLGGRKGIKLEFQIVSTEGIDYNQHLLDLAEEFGIVSKRGAWYYYGDQKAQGSDKAKKELPMDIIKDEIEKFILDREE